MNLLTRLARSESFGPLGGSFGMDAYMKAFEFNGNAYPLGINFTQPGSPQVDIDNSLSGYVCEVGNRDGVVAACVYARALLISQLRFKFRNITDGPQAQLFGTQALSPLETTDRARLLQLAEMHVSYAGNAYWYLRDDGTFRLLRPDWISIVLGSNSEPDTPGFALDAEVIGYLYHPGGRHDLNATLLVPSQVAHWAPEPDPLVPWRGQSWVTSVMKDIIIDRQASDHLSGFFENAATPNLVFKMEPSKTPDQVREYADALNSIHSGVDNAYKNLYLGGGTDVMVVGSDISKMDYETLQAGYESRIAARARVPAVILGIREGLKGSALNSGNYTSARRMWSDGWFLPTSDSLCDTLAPLIDLPSGGVELTFDPTRVAFLQEDRTDEAEIQQHQAITIRQFIDAGFLPDTAVTAVTSNDFSKLKHSGLPSVQVQPAPYKPDESPEAAALLPAHPAALPAPVALPPGEPND